MNLYYALFDYAFNGNIFKKHYMACLETNKTGDALETMLKSFRLTYRDVDIKNITVRRISQEHEWTNEVYQFAYRGD